MATLKHRKHRVFRKTKGRKTRGRKSRGRKTKGRKTRGGVPSLKKAALDMSKQKKLGLGIGTLSGVTKVESQFSNSALRSMFKKPSAAASRATAKNLKTLLSMSKNYKK